jgi:hypothetical protein
VVITRLTQRFGFVQHDTIILHVIVELFFQDVSSYQFVAQCQKLQAQMLAHVDLVVSTFLQQKLRAIGTQHK